MFGLIYPYGIVLQALAILHFVRRRPETYWLWIILMFGGVGALIYIVVEVIPDAGLLRGTFRSSPAESASRSSRGSSSTTRRSATTRSSAICISTTGSLRGRASASTRSSRRRNRSIRSTGERCAKSRLNDFAAAAADLERVVTREPKYDYQRAAGLRAHVLAKIGQREKADALFTETLQVSTLSETQYNYACFLAAEGREDEAREWADRILRKKATMPDYIRRRERPWFRRARALAKRLT